MNDPERGAHRLLPVAIVSAALVCTLPTAATAHALRFATVHLRVERNGAVRGALREAAHTTHRGIELRLDGPGCHPLAPEHLSEAGSGLWRLAWRCDPAAERLALHAVRLPPGARLHLRWEGPFGTQVTLLSEGERAVWQARGATTSRAQAGEPFLRYLSMGVQHILEGADHLAFVLLLTLLVTGLRQLITTVTSFTLGHSVTLAIAALGAAPPSAPVEALVALSIVLAAREAMLHRPTGLLGRRPPLAAGAFGLLHGLAFAGALREVGLPPGAAVPALLGFNVGVEVGQLLFVTALLLTFGLLGATCRGARCVSRAGDGPSWRTLPVPARTAAAALIGAWAAFLFFERSAAVVHAEPNPSPSPRRSTITHTAPPEPARERLEAPTPRAPFPSPGHLLDLSPSHSTSIGSPSDGRLLGGVPLPPRGPGFLADPRKSPTHRYGTVEVVRAVVRALGLVARQLPGNLAWVGDLSAPEGGPLDGHRSHQAGRDVDISFFVLDGAGRPRAPVVTFFDEQGRAVDFGDLADPGDDVELRFDVPRTWRLVRALLECPDPDARVQRILLAAHLHALLREEAVRRGTPRHVLERFEQVSCQPRGAPHDDHLHVRFYCSAEDLRAGCLDLPPIFSWRADELHAVGLRPRLAPRRHRRRRSKVRSVAEARAAAGPMDAEVVRWLDRRERWMRRGSRQRPCRRPPRAALSPRAQDAP